MLSKTYYTLRRKADPFKGQYVTYGGVSREPMLDSLIESKAWAEEQAQRMTDVEVVPVTMNWKVD